MEVVCYEGNMSNPQTRQATGTLGAKRCQNACVVFWLDKLWQGDDLPDDEEHPVRTVLGAARHRALGTSSDACGKRVSPGRAYYLTGARAPSAAMPDGDSAHGPGCNARR